MQNTKRIRFKPMDFTEAEISQSAAKGSMLALIAEVSGRCNMACPYCYRMEESTIPELSLEERLQLIRDGAELGARAYHIVGAGEPLIDPLFPKQVKEARRLGMEVMVPTNGLGLQSNKMLDFLEEQGASILLKLNSFKAEIEYALTGKKDYATKRNGVLSTLLKRGTFNSEERNSSDARTITTRLAIDGMITNLNLDEMLDILNFCREHNISPFLTTFIPVGRTANEIGFSAAPAEVNQLFAAAKKQDASIQINDGNANIYLGGQECNQRGLGPYVDIYGEVKVCVGEQKSFGNIRKLPLKKLWDRVRKKTVRHVACGRLSCPSRKAASLRL